MSARPADRGLQLAIAALTLGTAIIHLTLAFPDPAFIMNGLGYLALLTALLLPQATRYHGTVGWILVGYTALTILLWVLLGAHTTLGYVDKAIEVALIATLIAWLRRRSHVGARSSSP